MAKDDNLLARGFRACLPLWSGVWLLALASDLCCCGVVENQQSSDLVFDDSDC